MNLDGYYGYNFNRPFTGTNLLRAYDVSGNSFAINQAGLVIERAPDVAAGRRFGARIDLMAGQATETLQGSPVNELRPEVFRHLFQAYGTYIVPAGQGVTVDFGKWASSFGIENNYTKDQLNYSRSYWFNFLPFYHMGFRATYPVTRRINASYWLTNGLNQTEDFNGFKSQAVLLNFQPSSRVSANLNYFNGREQRRVDRTDTTGPLPLPRQLYHVASERPVDLRRGGGLRGGPPGAHLATEAGVWRCRLRPLPLLTGIQSRQPLHISQ
jgi:hypothetical protein